MIKRLIPMMLALLFVLTGCGAEERLPAMEPKREPSSASEPSAPESEPGPEEPAFPEGSSQPSQGEEAPDPSLTESEQEQEANGRRANALFSEIGGAFSEGLSKESYSYYTCYSDGGSVILEIGVTDEAAVDAFLASWTGTKWDTLLKIPGSASQARQEEFAERAEKLAIGPNIDIHITAHNGPSYTENGRIFISAAVTNMKPWEDIPQEIKDLADEMGIPEYMLYYICHSDDGTVTNTIP